MTNIEEQTLRNHFKDRVGRYAFQRIDGELRVCGKYAEITVIDADKLDVWVVTPDRSPISTHKLTALISGICAVLDVDVHKLNGEAWFQTETIPDSLLRRFGVPKKRQLSEEQKKAMVERVRKYRF